MKISDLFLLHPGNNLELYHMEAGDDTGIHFISRTAQNNGIAAQVFPHQSIPPFPAGYLTVALGGSVLSAFVQEKPFYTAFHIMVLEPKKEMSLKEKLFYCMCIKKNNYRYSYGRQANKTLSELILKLPANTDYTPDYKAMERYMKALPFSDRIKP